MYDGSHFPLFQKDQERDNRKEAAKERKLEQKRKILLEAIKVCPHVILKYYWYRKQSFAFAPNIIVVIKINAQSVGS